MATSKSNPKRQSAALRNPAQQANAVPERFPATADDKITCAKHIVQAVVAAHDAEALQGENYDIHWPLSLAVELLEQASNQLDAVGS